jgi:hypothetical protein
MPALVVTARPRQQQQQRCLLTEAAAAVEGAGGRQKNVYFLMACRISDGGASGKAVSHTLLVQGEKVSCCSGWWWKLVGERFV